MGTLISEEVRRAIQGSLAGFFGRPIAVEERALRVLALHRRNDDPKAPLPLHIWRAIEVEFPLVLELYRRIGVPSDLTLGPPFPRAERRRLGPDVDYSRFDWQETLISLFGPHDALSRVGEVVQRSGRLRLTDIALSLVAPFSKSLTRGSALLGYHNGVLKAFQRIANEGQREVDRRSIHEIASFARAELLDLIHFDNSEGSQSLAFLREGGQWRIIPVDTFGGFKVDEQPLADGSLWLARGSVLKPVDAELDSKIREFEELINSQAKERDIQRHLESNPEFLCWLGPYSSVYPQLILRREDGSSLRPDFFLERLDGDFCDICDIKLPTQELVRYQKNRHRFRDAVMEGVSQLSEYRDWFEEESRRDAFHERYGLTAYRPEVVLIAGRRSSFLDDIARVKLESGLPAWVRLATYDDVLTNAQAWRTLATRMIEHPQ